MCGIIGVAACSHIVSRDWLGIGSHLMAHRGPDDAGEWWSHDGRVGLGHRRLAIVDLSLAGHQPMHDHKGRLTIVYNGEIYNYLELRNQLIEKGYTFKSNSDTEVILAGFHEWGDGCLDHLRGMFAFAIYDLIEQRIFLARDRAGEKPLFYTFINGEFRFSSELKGLLADPALPRRINAEALDCYLAMGFVPGDLCILSGVNKLPPAHALEFNLTSGKSRTWSYWHLPEQSNDSFNANDEEYLIDELDALLESSVRQQLVADVPVGVLLSGGLDSSLITAMAVRASSHVKTFTVGFPGSKKHDESAHARLIARYFDTEHVELEAHNVDVGILHLLAKQYDEPMCDSSMVPSYLVSNLIRKHCTVALGGDGGDELFGGYIHYNRILWTQQKFGWIPRLLRQIVSELSGRLLPVGFKGRNWLQALGTDWDFGLPLIGTFFDPATRQQLTGESCSWMAAEQIRGKRVPLTSGLLRRATQMEFENYMPEDILVKVDRASMLNSLEIRAPFLDTRIIEFAFGKVPSTMKATVHKRKILLKKLAEKILPPEFDRQRKQGFSIPLEEWLKNGIWRDLFHDVLFDSQSIFDKKIVQSLFHGQDMGRNNQERLFGLVMFELWRREYQITL